MAVRAFPPALLGVTVRLSMSAFPLQLGTSSADRSSLVTPSVFTFFLKKNKNILVDHKILCLILLYQNTVLAETFPLHTVHSAHSEVQQSRQAIVVGFPRFSCPQMTAVTGLVGKVFHGIGLKTENQFREPTTAV